VKVFGRGNDHDSNYRNFVNLLPEMKSTGFPNHRTSLRAGVNQKQESYRHVNFPEKHLA
jgi:hypothetical protein